MFFTRLPGAVGHYIAKSDAEQANIVAANMGRDSNTLASLGGDVAGTPAGISGLPSTWVDQARTCNPHPDLAETAGAVCGVILERAQVTSWWAAGLLALFDE